MQKDTSNKTFSIGIMNETLFLKLYANYGRVRNENAAKRVFRISLTDTVNDKKKCNKNKVKAYKENYKAPVRCLQSMENQEIWKFIHESGNFIFYVSKTSER